MAGYDLAEYVQAYLDIEREQGEKISNADMAADIADVLCAQGFFTEEEADLAVFKIEKELPYYTGRDK